MSFPTTHKFRGTRYKLRWRKPPLTRRERKDRAKSKGNEIVGKLYAPEPGCAAIIYINPAGSALDLLDSVVHESLHACYPDLDEPAVRDGCAAIWCLLKKMGIKVSFKK